MWVYTAGINGITEINTWLWLPKNNLSQKMQNIPYTTQTQVLYSVFPVQLPTAKPKHVELT